MEQITQRITAVINTLNGAMLRADQIDAIQRINVCTRELSGLIEDIKAAHAAQKEDGK